jgi:glycosyltransferase involved in cell wall biosynthesis
VVAYDVGAIPETAGPGALLAPPEDEGQLMRSLARVCDDLDLARRLSADGRRHAERYSWDRTAELTWDVYERVS